MASKTIDLCAMKILVNDKRRHRRLNRILVLCCVECRKSRRFWLEKRPKGGQEREAEIAVVSLAISLSFYLFSRLETFN